MSVPRELLLLTESKALVFGTYGSAGLWKTHAAHSLPPPILFNDWEGGTLSVLPWIRRRRDCTEDSWTVYDDATRQQAFDMLLENIRKSIRVAPAPLIDVVRYHPTNAESYDKFLKNLSMTSTKSYNSLVVDSMQQLSIGTQTHAKGVGNEDKTMTSVNRAWARAQENAYMCLAKLTDVAAKGVFVYVTASEDIAKDYVTDPQSRRAGDQRSEEPYSIRGTVNLPGKLANALPHNPDVLMHARLVTGKPTWITAPEAISEGSGAWWDAKDRTGRLSTYQVPFFYTILKQIYGAETVRKIYAHAPNQVKEENEA